MDKPVINPKYVSVSGYGYSGSGACVDLLKEFEGFGALQGEFRIAKDPHGLCELEELLVHNWDVIRHDIDIKDFLAYCDILSRGTGIFNKVGKDFSNKLDIDFMLESKKYIDSLAYMTYLGDTAVHRYNIPAYKNFIMKLRTKFSKYRNNNAKQMFFARPVESDFIKETRNYINNLFYKYMELEKIDTLVIDQAISPTNITDTSRYFEHVKVIIIDRDPRDIYANMVKRNHLFGPELLNRESYEKYIQWYEQSRRLSEKDRNNSDIDEYVLRLSFEDLVFKFDDSVEKISNFLGGNMRHIDKGKYFSTEYSAKNVGLWKHYHDQSIMDKIGKELKSYCYDY